MQRNIKIVLFRTKRFIVGKRARPQSFTQGYHTVMACSRDSFNNWCKTLNVSVLYKR